MLFFNQHLLVSQILEPNVNVPQQLAKFKHLVRLCRIYASLFLEMMNDPCRSQYFLGLGCTQQQNHVCQLTEFFDVFLFLQLPMRQLQMPRQSCSFSMKNNLLRQNAPWHTSAAVVLFNIKSQAWSCNLHQPYSSNLGTHFV